MQMKNFKEDFPLLRENPVVYLDSAATAQRPESVINSEMEFYKKCNANPLRGLYDLGFKATECYEQSRETVRKFINARSEREIIFTRNATESLNLVAYSYGMNFLKKGDEILVTVMEHHSNQLPWRVVAEKTGRTDIFRSKKLQKDRIFPKNIWKAYSKPLLTAICLRA